MVIQSNRWHTIVRINGAEFIFAMNTTAANQVCGLGQEREYEEAFRQRFMCALTPADHI